MTTPRRTASSEHTANSGSTDHRANSQEFIPLHVRRNDGEQTSAPLTDPDAPAVTGGARSSGQAPSVPADTAMGHGIVGRLAASYARKSQHNDLGIEAQHEFNVARAAQDGYVIPNDPAFRFSDDKTKGYAKHRDDWDRLERVVMRGAGFSRVYVKNGTRWGRWRDIRERFYTEVHFEKHGVQVRYSQRHNQPVDYTNPRDPHVVSDVITSAVDSVHATTEIDETITRHTIDRRILFTKGFYLGGARTPYGTVRWLVRPEGTSLTLLEPVPQKGTTRRAHCRFVLRFATDETVAIVKELYDLAEQGLSCLRIAGLLNARGVRPPCVRSQHRHERGLGWNHVVINSMLRDPLYKGDYVYGGAPTNNRVSRVNRYKAIETGCVLHTDTAAVSSTVSPILYVGYVPDPPISHDQWERVQQVLGNRGGRPGRKRGSAVYPLSGLIYCAHCGGRFYARSPRRTGSQAGENSGMYQHWLYRLRGVDIPSDACVHSTRAIPGKPLERIVMDAARAVLAGPSLRGAVQREIAAWLADSHAPSHATRLAELGQEIVTHAENVATLIRLQAARASDPALLASYQDAIDEASAAQAAAIRERDYLVSTRDDLMAAQRRADEHYAQADDLSAVFDAASPQSRKRILHSIVDRIDVDVAAEHITVSLRILPPTGVDRGWACVTG